MANVLVVGCGLTAAVTAALLRASNQVLKVELWDKARGTGI